MTTITPDSDAVAALFARVDELEARLTSPVAPVLDSLLSPAALARRLGVTERTLAEWRVGPPATGPAYVRIGRGVRYRPEAVDAWLLTQEHSSTHEEARR
ncbi:helix-turn-helix transcriptional regulator [Microbacterium oxydans]|uniref:helix-turn-helix transcriptional regulator n=1 Tax=Microbacterium oxydans TaxID=82380 RepID=UPI00366FEB9E